jgi:hypothetical protein
MFRNKSIQLGRTITIVPATLLRYIAYGFIVLLGAATFFLLQSMGVISAAIAGIVSITIYLYAISGIVAYGLIPLTIGLAILVCAQIGHHAGWWYLKDSLHLLTKLEIIENAAPILGLLGTMLGLWSALESLNVSKGLQAAIQYMSLGVGQALGSSVYGLILALIAFVMKQTYLSSSRKQEG